MNVKRIELYRGPANHSIRMAALAESDAKGVVLIETDKGRIYASVSHSVDGQSLHIHGEGRMNIQPDASNSVHIRFKR